ncbi:MAG: hypothetical protein HQK77_20935 [Desulfobacterales bacterium]|nr:hypothetical protein [Desulfobacterales bacterium]
MSYFLTLKEQHQLLLLIDDLLQAIENLLLTGLTTASDSTCKKIHVILLEASKAKLLRLSSSLRIINEEIDRFNSQSPNFSSKRLSFFINRAWLLGQGIAYAIKKNDQKLLNDLLWTPPNEPVSHLKVVTLGVIKKVVTGAFCAFEFRLRTLQQIDSLSLDENSPLIWSCLFPMKPNTTLPPEAFLHLPQRQGFTPNIFFEGKIIELQQVNISNTPHAIPRIILEEKSIIRSTTHFKEWNRFQAFDRDSIIKRIEAYKISPLDLDIERQEEITLQDWKLIAEIEENEQVLFKIQDKLGRIYDVPVPQTIEGDQLRKELRALKNQKNMLPLFGVMHYEYCRFVLQPLSLFTPNGMKYMTISEEKIDRAALLKALNF